VKLNVDPRPTLALDPDPPAVQLHELLSERQPEPRALLLAGMLAPNLAELLEDRRLILGRDPDARIADGDRDGPLGCRGGEADPAPLRGELDGIGQEVQQDLLHLYSHGGILAIHAEDDDLVMYMYEALEREGSTDIEHTPLVHSAMSEEISFRRVLRLAR
jgi:hypothetical protein